MVSARAERERPLASLRTPLGSLTLSVLAWPAFSVKDAPPRRTITLSEPIRTGFLVNSASVPLQPPASAAGQETRSLTLARPRRIVTLPAPETRAAVAVVSAA